MRRIIIPIKSKKFENNIKTLDSGTRIKIIYI